MNALFKRAPAAPTPVTWVDASHYKANGYAPLPIEYTRIDAGEETPGASPGDWCRYQFNPTGFLGGVPDDYGVGILTGLLPVTGGFLGLDECAASWLAVLRLDIPRDGKLVKEIERLIAAKRRWSPDATAQQAPVRMAPNSKALLLPYRLDARDPRELYVKPLEFPRPGDPSAWEDNAVSIVSAYSCFVAAGGGFVWRDGLDLRTVRRADLPLMSADGARDLRADIEALIDAHR